MSRGAFTHPRGQNCPQEGDSVFVGQKRVRVCTWGRSTGANGTQPSWPQMIRYQQEHHCVPTPSFTFGMHGSAPQRSRTSFLGNTTSGVFASFGQYCTPGRCAPGRRPLLISIADVSRAHFSRCSAQCVCPAAGRGLRFKRGRYVWKIAKDGVRNLERCSKVDRALCTGLRRRRILTRSGIRVPLLPQGLTDLVHGDDYFVVG